MLEEQRAEHSLGKETAEKSHNGQCQGRATSLAELTEGVPAEWGHSLRNVIFGHKMCGRVLWKALKDLWAWGRGNRSFSWTEKNGWVQEPDLSHQPLVQAYLAKPCLFQQIIRETQCCIFILTFVPVHQAVLSTKYSLCERPHSANTLTENIHHFSELAHKIVHWNNLAFLSLCFLLIWFSKSFLFSPSLLEGCSVWFPVISLRLIKVLNVANCFFPHLVNRWNDKAIAPGQRCVTTPASVQLFTLVFLWKRFTDLLSFF